MATHAAGDMKENAMHQPLLSPDEPLEVVVLHSGQLCLVSRDARVLFAQTKDVKIVSVIRCQKTKTRIIIYQ